jgi:hypothetical protein
MREKIELIDKIIKRAEKLGVTRGDRMTQWMDIEFATDQFDIKLEDWLVAENLDFMHDFIGIQSHMNRETCKVEEFFVPRYAGNQ